MTTRHKWALDLNHEHSRALDVKPPGDVPFVMETKSKVQEEDQTSLKIRKSWEVAKSLRPIITMGGLYWMTPAQASLIFLSILFPALFGHITAILEVNSVFAPFEDDKKRYSLFAQKIVYIIIQFAALLIGAYKLANYGLLPTTRADWLPWYHVSLPTEFSVGGLI